MAGAAGAAVRWGAMAFDPPAALLPLLQCLHALSFGATHLGALGCVARAAPAEFGATAQGYLAVALGLLMAAAMGVSGLLYAYSGGLAYGAMALAAAAGGLCGFAARRLAQGASQPRFNALLRRQQRDLRAVRRTPCGYP
jgi:PPP family 3-phenylpropionic acid transporter